MGNDDRPAFVWPDGFPPGCPPADALEATGDYYRLVTSNPPTLNDFRPWRAENPLRDGEKEKARHWGTSVFGDLADVVDVLQAPRRKARVPGSRDWMVALGTLRPEFGVISLPSGKPPRPSHRDWWIPKDIDPSPAFRVIEVQP